MLHIQDYLTQIDDLTNNSGLCVFNGLAAQQNHNAFGVFMAFLETIKPSQILEIGTGQGGFIAFIAMVLKKINIQTQILSYDIHHMSWYTDIMNQYSNLTIKTHDIFDNTHQIIWDKEPIELISQNGTSIILCDGGSKPLEFNILAKYMKTNDIIMAHDYAPNSEYFEQHMRNKIWNWHEIQDSDIIESCQKYGLEPFMKDEFLSVAWACFRKLS